MTEPYLGQIKLFAGNFAPISYALCNGQLLAIQSNTALFSLLGTTYGGNGQTTFGLPDFRGRTPIHFGQGPGLSQYVLGEESGSETVTLLPTEMPAHIHQISGAVIANSSSTNTPNGSSMFTNATPNPLYAITTANLLNLAPQSISITGGSQPHENHQPYLGLTFIIAIQGVFPSRN
jgi:microcystin-dependent protein